LVSGGIQWAEIHRSQFILVFGVLTFGKIIRQKERTMIRNITEPQWDKSKRQWLVTYKVYDPEAGTYTQDVWCDYLVSAERIIKEIKQREK
jgi:hypothetical protein